MRHHSIWIVLIIHVIDCWCGHGGKDGHGEPVWSNEGHPHDSLEDDHWHVPPRDHGPPGPHPDHGPPPSPSPSPFPHPFPKPEPHPIPPWLPPPDHPINVTKPFLYGLTYFPWRSINKNCSDLTEWNIHEDIRLISTLAKNIQIFDLYCNWTGLIVELTREYEMGLILGISLSDESDYIGQKEELNKLIKETSESNMSHILGITVGRTSMLNDNNRKSILTKIEEIDNLIKKSIFPDIPVTIINDIPSHDGNSGEKDLGPFSKRFQMISAGPQSASPKMDDSVDQFFYGFVYGWLDNDGNKKQKNENRAIMYTEFGYPSTAPDQNDADPHFAPPEDMHALMKISCLSGVSSNGSTPLMMFDHFGPPGPGPKSQWTLPKIKYFYHSAFDMPFEYGENDERVRWGLADFNTRQLKPHLKKALMFGGPIFGNQHFCNKMFPGKEDMWRQEKHGMKGEWVAIGVSMSLAILAVLTFVAVLVYKHRQEYIKRKKKLQAQDETSTVTTNAYVRTLASYLNRSLESSVDLISKADYENLSALVGREWLIEESALQFEEVIGEGHFGIVQRAKLLNYGETEDVAVKKLHVGAKNIRQFLSEGILMEQFHHINVLPLIGISFTSYYLPMIITPFMQKGDLLSYVKDGDNRLTVRQLLKFAQEISEGMRYMHDLKLIHRDLAGRNCMLNEELTVKIADFGLCRDISDSESYQTTRASDIPIRWMPPETIEKLEWTHKSDVWSYGVVLWELFTRGKQPYRRVPLVELRLYLKSGGRLSKPDGCPDIVYDLMKTCWHGQSEQRPNFVQLCEMIPALVHNLESDSILDVPDYYNCLTVLEMAEQRSRNQIEGHQES